MTYHKLSIPVGFKVSNTYPSSSKRSIRQASIVVPDYIDDIIRAEPLNSGITPSNGVIDIVKDFYTEEGSNKKMVELVWYGEMSVCDTEWWVVDITYTSKSVDREKKLDALLTS